MNAYVHHDEDDDDHLPLLAPPHPDSILFMFMNREIKKHESGSPTPIEEAHGGGGHVRGHLVCDFGDDRSSTG